MLPVSQQLRAASKEMPASSYWALAYQKAHFPSHDDPEAHHWQLIFTVEATDGFTG